MAAIRAQRPAMMKGGPAPPRLIGDHRGGGLDAGGKGEA